MRPFAKIKHAIVPMVLFAALATASLSKARNDRHRNAPNRRWHRQAPAKEASHLCDRITRWVNPACKRRGNHRCQRAHTAPGFIDIQTIPRKGSKVIRSPKRK